MSEADVKSSMPTLTAFDTSRVLSIYEQAVLDVHFPIERLATIQNMVIKAQKEEKKRLYIEAFFAAQSEIKKIEKRHFNDQTKSKFAKLEDILDELKPTAKKYGFSTSFGETKEQLIDGIKRLYYKITHVAGHSEKFYYSAPIDDVGIKGNKNKTDIMGHGSSVSYARRYLCCMAWDLNTYDDNDGQKIVYQASHSQDNRQFSKPQAIPTNIPEMISMLQKSQLLALIDEAESSVEVVLKKCNAPSLDEITVEMYKRVMKGLTDKIAILKAQDAKIINEQPEGLLNG